MPFTGRPLAPSWVCPAFGPHVRVVVSARAKPKMGRIDAAGIIAGVADGERARIDAIRDFVGNPMGEVYAPVNAEPSISARKGRIKSPTTITLANLCPE